MTPIEAQGIVQAYGAVLEERAAMGTIRDARSLPANKVRIKEALQIALRATSDNKMREHLKIAFISLADFQELSAEQILALQTWNRLLATKQRAMTIEELREEAAIGSAVADGAITIQERSVAEAEVLASELRIAGF